MRYRVHTILITASLLAIATGARAQSCKAICTPVFLWQGGAITTHAFSSDVSATTDFNLRFTVAAPTAIPRVTLVALFQWQPFAKAASNPFNGQTGDIDNNLPAIVYGATVGLITKQNTRGWFNSTFDILGLFSPAARASDTRAYTHKFLPELYVDLAPFNGLPQESWLRNVSVFGLVDYVATGLPSGAEQPWPIVTGLQFPIAPLP